MILSITYLPDTWHTKWNFEILLSPIVLFNLIELLKGTYLRLAYLTLHTNDL